MRKVSPKPLREKRQDIDFEIHPTSFQQEGLAMRLAQQYDENWRDEDSGDAPEHE